MEHLYIYVIFFFSQIVFFQKVGPMPRRMLFKIGVTFVIGIGIVLFYLVHLEENGKSSFQNSKDTGQTNLYSYDIEESNSQNSELKVPLKSVKSHHEKFKKESNQKKYQSKILEEAKHLPPDIENVSITVIDAVRSESVKPDLSPVYERYEY